MSSRIRAVGVVVPAHDEELLLPAALTALEVAAQRARQRGVTVDVLVVADACVDSTYDVARSAGSRVVTVNERSVGRARSIGVSDVLALHRHVPSERLWLASTDADSRVPPEWLTQHVELADRGAEVVLGTVDVEDWTEHPAHVEQRWRAEYEVGDGHRHVHGANVGARADVYLAVGGFPALDSGEDVSLAAALRHRHVVRTGQHPVMTSGRTRGRAPQGFAARLSALA